MHVEQNSTAVTWLKYYRYGVKHYRINQSKTLNITILVGCVLVFCMLLIDLLSCSQFPRLELLYSIFTVFQFCMMDGIGSGAPCPCHAKHRLSGFQKIGY